MPLLKNRLELLERLGAYMLSDDAGWIQAQQNAELANGWFTHDNISFAIENIATQFLAKDKLEAWVAQYTLPTTPKKVGIIMAGNIPLVGFHDFLCGFVSGHQLYLKLSSKDEVLIRFIIDKLTEWDAEVKERMHIADLLKGCDAYIATGSNNTARYFEQYFSKYPNIIRKNRTSVAVLDGAETDEELQLLGKDIFSFFGLGCRNVTQLYIPKDYDLSRVLKQLSTYEAVMQHHKYKNNYDYHLAIYLLNKVPYLTNDSLLMVENPLPFSPVSVLHYQFYDDRKQLIHTLKQDQNIQIIIGNELIPFGQSQIPGLNNYADNIDVMEFLCSGIS